MNGHPFRKTLEDQPGGPVDFSRRLSMDRYAAR